MASLTLRSSRKLEGLQTRSSARNNLNALGTHQQSNIGRKKRPRDSLDDEKPSISQKRVKIAIEIDPFPKDLPKSRSIRVIQNEHPPQNRTATQTPTKQFSPKTTPHHEKVVNGIKHELDRLQDQLSPPIPPNLKDEKRKLRSQEGQRFKSELSLYFPDYDEVIGNDPKEDHILNFDTPVIIVDSAKTSTKQPSTRKGDEYALKDFPSSLFDDLHDAQRVDFSFLKTHNDGEDPLSDDYFESIHKRPERQEKGIRNNDRGRAQHEKDQVIRLLEGLQGPDWLKIMGVSGVTDSRKKEFEPARHQFVKGCLAIIDKFRIWRDEEKRRKLEKEQAIAEAEAEEEDEAIEDDEEDMVDEIEGSDQEGCSSDGDPPDYSDVDASAARQLHEEAFARSLPLRPSKRSRDSIDVMVPATHELEDGFKSFFSKPHLREAALGKNRRSGRVSSAWGHPIPEVDVAEFSLPEEYRDEETLKVHARKKRRDRRVSKN